MRRPEMRSKTTISLVIACLLVLSGVCFLPSVSGQGPENSLVGRVEALEALVGELIVRVGDLTERVGDLEEQGPGTNSFDVLHLNLRSDLPENPDEGDICLMRHVDHTGYEGSILFYFRAGEWRRLVIDPTPMPPPGPGPGPST
jgi:hypothetical protein